MLLPDVNVLIYAHREDVADHEAFAGWLRRVADGPEAFALSELVLSAFARVVTHVKIFVPPTPIETALEYCDRLIDLPNSLVIRPGKRHWSIFKTLCLGTSTQGPIVADAYLAALAIEHGCQLITCDSDFARFPGLRWSHPLQAS